jgi:hypothetical protein
VKEGVLYITEDENAFSVEAGEYILLSPGLEHYSHMGFAFFEHSFSRSDKDRERRNCELEKGHIFGPF